MNKQQNILYIDILKIIACFLVIINHSGSYILNYTGNHIVPFYCFMFSLCKMGVAIFIMVTAILILDKQFSFKQISKMILRVLIPTLIFTLIIYIQVNGLNTFNVKNFIIEIIAKPYITPYWYIYMLILLYIATPFLQKMIKSFENKDYIIFSIFFMILPGLVSLIKLYLKIEISGYFFAASISSIIGIYVTGNYISKIKLSKKYFISSVIIFIFAFIFMFSSMYIPYINNGKISFALDTYSALPVVIMSCSFVYLIRYVCEALKLKDKKNSIHIIATTTFGIYLIHYRKIYYIYSFIIIQKIFKLSPYIGIFALEISVFIICSIFIYIIKKVPIVKKYL